MARNQTNTSQARELTEAELDAVSGGDTKSKQTTDKQQAYLELTLLNTLTSSYWQFTLHRKSRTRPTRTPCRPRATYPMNVGAHT
jgi:hypothetical protein